MLLVIANSQSEVLSQPAVELVSCPSIATFLKGLYCFLVEGGETKTARVCAPRERSSTGSTWAAAMYWA